MSNTTDELAEYIISEVDNEGPSAKLTRRIAALIHRTQVESRLEELRLLLTDSHTNPSHDWNYVEDRIEALEAALEKQA